MSLFALPVTDADVKTIYNAITRKVLSDAAAAAEAAAINNGNDTVFNYAQSLLDANISFSQVAMGMPSLMFNKTPSLATLDNITNVFLPPQVSLALARGFEPTVYAAEATGLALSNGADFAANFGALSNTDFALKVSQLTGINTTAILGWVNNWTAFYTQNPSAVPSGSSISLASKGAALGDALGNALILGLPIQDTIENALLTIATGQYAVGVPITSLPQHTPLQGEGPVGGDFTVNVDNAHEQCCRRSIHGTSRCKTFSGRATRSMLAIPRSPSAPPLAPRC